MSPSASLPARPSFESVVVVVALRARQSARVGTEFYSASLSREAAVAADKFGYGLPALRSGASMLNSRLASASPAEF